MRIKSRKVTMESGITVDYIPDALIFTPGGKVELLMFLGSDNAKNESLLYLNPNGQIFNDGNYEAVHLSIISDEIEKWNKGE